MKFSVFADFHHWPERFMRGTIDELTFIQQRAEEAGAEFIIHAGDFCHGPSLCPEFINLYNNFHIPSYHILGNHDTDCTPYEETLRMYNMPDGHYYFDHNGYRIVVCDPNYLFLDGEYIHYSMSNCYPHPKERDYMPPEQLEWLKETIESSPYHCILISHESFERENCGMVKNRMEVRQIINDANRKKPHSELMCINGHLHRDNIRILDNVCYFDLNSTSWDYLATPHNLYPKELHEKYTSLSKTVVYNDPVHAIITLEGTSITIEGMESSMFMGINREHTENDICDEDGRPVVPKVQTAKFRLE